MITYKVGEKYPLPLPSQGEGLFIQSMSNGAFDLLCVMGSPTAAERRAFKSEMLDIGLYIESGIPFVVVWFPGNGGLYDAPFNALKVSKEWFSIEGNAITLLLVDRLTGIVQTIRLLGVKMVFMEAIKAAALQQFELYETMADVEMKIIEIYERVSSEQMNRNKKFIQTFVR